MWRDLRCTCTYEMDFKFYYIYIVYASSFILEKQIKVLIFTYNSNILFVYNMKLPSKL